jgi:hypothetical protein
MNDAGRLKKLLLMLSSDQPGEVVAAAKAIGRSLKTDGSDWHDLARRLSAPARAHTSEQPRRDNNNKDNSNKDNSNKDWRALREYCLQHDDLLRPRESEFIDSIGEWRGGLTEKQSAWLIAIYARIRRATA